MPVRQRAAILAGILGTVAGCLADVHGIPQDAPSEQAPTPAPSATAAAASVVAPLFPDGSLLKRAQGQVVIDPRDGVPAFVLWSRSATAPQRRIWLMPCAATDELVQLQHNGGDAQLIELSGLVTAHRGENWLLPAVAGLAGTTLNAPAEGPPIPPGGRRAPAVPAESPRTPTAPSGDEPPTATAPPTVEALSPETIADQLEALLDEAIPVAPRSGDPGAPTVAPADPTREERGVVPPAQSPHSDASDSGNARPRALLGHPTRVQDRRCTIIRDERTGALRMAFAASAGELPASAEILPCAELDRLEVAARRSARGVPVLASGLVTQGSDGRAYILPTVVRPLRAGKWILP